MGKILYKRTLTVYTDVELVDASTSDIVRMAEEGGGFLLEEGPVEVDLDSDPFAVDLRAVFCDQDPE